MNPTLSIITVCFNSEKTVQRTFDSIQELKKISQEIEYVVIDGASTDATNQIITQNKSLIDHHLTESDEGIYDGMNKGARLATGEYLIYINSDDWVNPEEMIKALEHLKQKKLDFLACTVKIVNLKGEVIGERKPNLAELSFPHHRGMPCSHQGFIINRILFKKLGGFNIKYKVAADYELILKSLTTSKRFENSPLSIAYYTLGGVSYGNSAKSENFELQKQYLSLPFAIFFYLREVISISVQRILPKWLILRIKKFKGSKFEYIQQK